MPTSIEEGFFDLLTLNGDENCGYGWQFEDEIGGSIECSKTYIEHMGNKSTLFSTVVSI